MKNGILAIALLIVSSAAFGQTSYYVSTSGNNGNAGSLASPWLTIQYGLNQLSSADTLFVLTGVYSEKISIPIDNITLKSNFGSQPIIDATGITSQNAILYIGNKNNILVDGFELRNNIQNDAQGILIDGSGANNTVKNCIIHDIHFSSNPNAVVSASTNAQGIIVYGTNASTPITNLKLQGNKLYNCRLGYSEGIAVNGNVDGFEVSNNLVYDLTNIGIDVIGHEGTSPNPSNDQARNGKVRKNTVHHCLSIYATSGGIYVDGGKNLIVENNTSYHNGYGIEVGAENVGTTTDSIVIRNNVFYDNETAGIALGGFDYPSGSGKVTRAIIRNNTCYSNDYSNSGLGELYLSYSEDCTIENNIFYTSSQDQLAYAELTQPSLYFDHNLAFSPDGNFSTTVDWNGTFYSGFSAFIAGSTTNGTSVFGNPMFSSASISSPNFHIASNSPAVNAGHPATTISSDETDYFNELRVEQNIIDCGADEYGNSLGNPEFVQLEFLVYPNPATETISIESKFPIESLVIFNMNGERLIEGCGIQTIDVSELKSGLYFIQLTSGGSISNKKFQKR